ncbi:MAG: SDR family NAD(P)-dependent oxidoreductase, partial [Anaerolineae bacterium]|nr:SDR family NAD(P)-dependent oxidoreductase [Anaerolineae bacterium]
MTETKTVLITGAAGGIGRATVALFVEKGWRVLGVDRAPFDHAQDKPFDHAQDKPF